MDDEWIFGMGSFNMKSAMGTYICAVEAIRKAGIRLKGDVVIAGVAGEIEKAPVNDHEGPQYQGYGVGTKFAITHGAIADYCILGEPTNMMLIPAPLRQLLGEDHRAGTPYSPPGQKWKKCHQQIPGGTGRHPRVDSRLLRPQQPRRFPAAGERVRWRRAGAGAARTPDNCVIYMDVRTLPEDLPLKAYNDVRAMIARVVDDNPQLAGTKVETFMSVPGTSIPDDHALVQHVIKAHSDQLGKAPEMGIETWMSDAAHMNRYGIPTVNYGSAGRIRSGGGGFSTHQGRRRTSAI